MMGFILPALLLMAVLVSGENRDFSNAGKNSNFAEADLTNLHASQLQRLDFEKKLPEVRVFNGGFAIGNTNIKFKGTNYYPRDHPWAAMWSDWDWPTITADVARIASAGLNCVRILVPYSQGGWDGPRVPADHVTMLYNLINLFGSHGVYSVVTLFDWETSWPAEGSSRANDHVAYIRAIVSPLHDNSNILWWDVKNEPDHPSNIDGHDDWDQDPTQRDTIVAWLKFVILNVKSITAKPVSTGTRWWTNIRAVLPFVDVAMVHSYWPDTGSRRLPDIRAWMSQSPQGVRPLVLEEFGWPSDPDGTTPVQYSVGLQLQFYKEQLAGFAMNNVSACLQWQTYDLHAPSSSPSLSNELFFGLYFFNYTAKPAANYYSQFEL
eukprot:m.133542 g.133542  ORF g.133542 m.133542 type:complete len:378 (-) comp14832_c1_seq1:25-1158(-)